MAKQRSFSEDSKVYKKCTFCGATLSVTTIKCVCGFSSSRTVYQNELDDITDDCETEITGSSLYHGWVCVHCNKTNSPYTDSCYFCKKLAEFVKKEKAKNE